MKKWLNWSVFWQLCICTILGAELFLLLDLAVVLCGGMLPLYTPVLFVPAAAVVLLLCFWKHRKAVPVLAVMVPATIAVLVGLGYAGWRSFSTAAVYEHPDAGKHQIYGDRKVMVVVPHQDDELNILGGVLEEYVRYGSELHMVFVTNGDYVFSADTRLREALAVCAEIGIPEEHVIFLGYGNEWQKEGPHIYNADSETMLLSYAGKTKTYAMADHPAYREGGAYTRGNLERDLKDVILERRPDVVFCSDYDHHIDHRAVSLLFEKVMGQLLKDNPDYAPAVYKGYAYGTAWEAEPDYYTENILSTQDLFAEPYCQNPEVYRWEDRVRMPVAGDTLSRSLLSAQAFKTLSLHDSQGASGFAESVINGDKVFWQRRTNSLTLHAEVTATSGAAEKLHDFMLVDDHDLKDNEFLPCDGVWVPETSDAERAVTVTLEEPADIARILLYDHPSDVDNVKNALITFADGTEVETGPLDPNGAATVISVERKNISGFSVTLLETEGDQAGLSEIEAFEEMPESEGRFIKLMDGEGNFLYDYRMPAEGSTELHLYTHGELPEVTAEKYTVGTAWGVGTAVLEDNVICVTCPAGETMVLNVTCNESGVSDSIMIRNPGKMERLWQDFWMSLEEKYCNIFIQTGNDVMLRTNLYRVWERIDYIIRHI